MKKIFLLILFLLLVSSMAYWIQQKDDKSVQPESGQFLEKQNGKDGPVVSGFGSPMDRAAERVTKKPFGKYVEPGNSPVDPERFQGYHTAADFEIFSDETDKDVPVRAVCEGELRRKGRAQGYGGYAVQACQLEDKPMTVIYGHLDLESVTATVSDNYKIGDQIGILGDAYSSETDGERKHLHLGFHRGSAINILGYVNSENQLSGWIDPCLYVCKN